MENASDDNSDLPNAAVIAALEQLLTAKFPQQSYGYNVEHATKKGENYIGVVYRIIVHLATGNFSLILKVPPHNPIRRKQFFARPCFLREALAYDEFLPLVARFQASKGIAVEECGFHEYAECYGTLTDECDEAVFLEDLRCKQFQLFDRFDELQREHVLLVITTYAKLHAVSFAIKDQQPEMLAKFKDIIDIFEQRKDEPHLAAYFEELKKSALSSLNEVEDEKYSRVLKKYFQSSFFDLFIALIDGKRCEPYAVVCHGDCWNNNMMFKQKDGKVIDMRLIDWQVMRYSSPVVDIMYFLFTCTTREFRKAHYNEMLNEYYNTLTAHIKRLGSDPQVIFPRDAFNNEVQSRAAVGLLLAMIVLPITTIRGEDAPNLEELSTRLEEQGVEAGPVDLQGAGLLVESNKDAYSKRMRDVVVDCIDYGYI